jgi:hypothetical protein
MEVIMTRMLATLMVCAAAAALPVSAFAQNDNAYCSALAQKYQRYVGDNEFRHRSQQRDATVDAAITACPTNASASIPVIEKALQDAQVSLPPRT